MTNFVRGFQKFQESLRINESVIVRDDKFIIGGIVLKQSVVNSHVSKVKAETGKNLRQMYSDQDIAEQLVIYLVDKYGNADDIPASALLGGEEEMEQEVSNVSPEDEDVSVGDEMSDMGEQEEVSDVTLDDVDEFETIEEPEESNLPDESSEEDKDEDEDEDEDGFRSFED